MYARHLLLFCHIRRVSVAEKLRRATSFRCLMDCNSRCYENLDNRKCLQGTRNVNMTSDKELSKKAIWGPILGSVIYTLGLYQKTPNFVGKHYRER